MKKILLTTLLFFMIYGLFAATKTTAQTGDWISTTTWVGNVLPDSTDVVIVDNNDIITIKLGETFTITDLWLGNKSIINVYGTLIIDSLHINNNAALNVTGNVDILGGASLAQNTTLTINNIGTVDISGNVDTKNGSKLVVDGTMTIGGNLTGTTTVSGVGTLSVVGSVGKGIKNLGPLPIDLLYFKTYYDYNKTVLIWATASETNNDYFILEYSINANDWNTLAVVNGAGNSSIQIDYSYNHYTNESYYYRLTQIDYDGKFEVFDIISSQVNNNVEQLDFKVFDVSGKYLGSYNKQSILNFNTGIYILRNSKQTLKIGIK